MQREPDALRAALAELGQRSLLRRRVVDEAELANAVGGHAMRAGRDVLNFCSNDYLGLARLPEIAAAMATAAKHWGAGTGASHYVSGHGPEHQALERELAEFTHRDAALLFSTGYMANLGAVAALVARGENTLQDELNHASLIDATRLSGAKSWRYTHGDAEAAAAQAAVCQSSSSQPLALVATDGVFSMDGDLAPLPQLAKLAVAARSWLLVDDAHGLGVLGKTGRGSCEHFGLDSEQVPILVGTLGKAFGSFGAFVAGSADLIDYLQQRARTAIYTTALPQPVAAATRAALRVAQRDAWRREKLQELTALFRDRAAVLGLHLASSLTPIQPIILGEAARALQVSAALLAAGFWVSAIRPPTVPQGTARLRVTLSAAHERADVEALVEALAQAVQSRLE